MSFEWIIAIALAAVSTMFTWRIRDLSDRVAELEKRLGLSATDGRQ
jgi:hypothetical protein